MSISVVINTKNAAQSLQNALDSASFADEVIVVDMNSIDSTTEIAKKSGAKVFSFKDVGYVEPAREFAINKATKDWILVLDADEVIPSTLADELLKIAGSNDESALHADCYYLARRNQIWGRWLTHTGWWPDYILRFFKRGYVHWPAELHSVPVTKGKVLQLPAKEDLAIKHYNYPTISSFIQRLDRYTGVQAKEQSVATEEVTGLSIFTAFKNEFVRRFAAEKGFLDQTAGVGLSLWQALSETTVQLKIWENQGFPSKKSTTFHDIDQVLQDMQAELRYWHAEYQISHSKGFKNIYWRVRRKLKR